MNQYILPKNAQQIFINGPQGKLDCLVVSPQEIPRGVALIMHPDPLNEGRYTNKVVQTIVKVLVKYGYICYCPHVSGVGLSAGVFDVNTCFSDVIAIHQYINELHADLPLILGGFSFGCSLVAQLSQQALYHKLILIAPAITRFMVSVQDPHKTLVIYGENDEIIDVVAAKKWGLDLQQSIIWFADCSHFFHGKLLLLQQTIEDNLQT
jgi:alpha/beta superfamily hydrolase